MFLAAGGPLADNALALLAQRRREGCVRLRAPLVWEQIVGRREVNGIDGFRRDEMHNPVFMPPLSVRGSVPRIDRMSGSAAHLKAMTRSR